MVPRWRHGQEAWLEIARQTWKAFSFMKGNGNLACRFADLLPPDLRLLWLLFFLCLIHWRSTKVRLKLGQQLLCIRDGHGLAGFL